MSQTRGQHQAGPVVLQVAKDLDMADTVKAAQEGAVVHCALVEISGEIVRDSAMYAGAVVVVVAACCRRHNRVARSLLGTVCCPPRFEPSRRKRMSSMSSPPLP